MTIKIASSEENTLETTKRGCEYRTNGYWVNLTDEEDGTYNVAWGDERGCDGNEEFANLIDAIHKYDCMCGNFDLPQENDYWNESYGRGN